jgi:DNA-binding IclR family transcriptional regulator
MARLEPPPRHADLAAQVGTTREQVTRELSSLTRQGLLQKSGRALLVKDLHRLEELVRGASEGRALPQPGGVSLAAGRRTPCRGERYSRQ